MLAAVLCRLGERAEFVYVVLNVSLYRLHEQLIDRHAQTGGKRFITVAFAFRYSNSDMVIML